MLVVVVLCVVAALLATSALALAVGRAPMGGRLVYGACLAACLVGLAAASAYLASGAAEASAVRLPLGLPWLGAHFRVDALSAFFLIVVNLGAASAALFGFGYGREDEPGRVLPFFAAFLAGLNLVVVADDAFSFLLAWEFMSLSSWALVLAHHRDPANAHAGFVYIVMASFGTLALLLAFGLLAGPAGGYGFEAMRGHEISPGLAALILTLVVLGAGSKAGVVPLHAWLPLAHPAAPSHVSALMSGVMTKVAVYGFVRIVFDLLGEPHWAAGAAVLALGGITAVLGVLYALMQHDLKRLLAYHTVENIGIIFIGLGLAMSFQANGLAAAAALSLTAALFHAFNHCVFKSLLFYGAGAVLHATGERDMERLGGLIHRMPKTAFAFLVGAAAISALPPLNGFASEWLTLQAILLTPDLPQWGLRFLAPAVGAMLALSAALAAACFVKAFGVTFLGRPRSEPARQAHEVGPAPLAAMFALAAICVLAGALPGAMTDLLGPAVRQLAESPRPAGGWALLVPVAPERGAYSGLLLFAAIGAAVAASLLVLRRLSAAVRRGPAWDCGFPDPRPQTQYTASSFAQPIRRVFATTAFGARETVDMPEPGELRPARLTVSLRDPIWERGYEPVAAAVGFAAQRFNHLQFLTIRRYLSLVFAALVGLLAALALWS